MYPLSKICTGRFSVDRIEDGEQIAVALDDGDVHLVTGFVSKLWFSSGLVLSSIAPFSLRSSVHDDCHNIILGSGHFDAIVGFHDGHKVLHHRTDDWVSCLTVSQLTTPKGTCLSSNSDYVAIATLSNTIEVLELSH